MNFTFVQSKEELRSLYKPPSNLAKRKVIHQLDAHCRMFIASSPFLVIASHDKNGKCDASPRGGQPGFVEIVDDCHLLIPDKPGNNRIDSIMNFTECPYIGMLFLLPGVSETLRINGSVGIIRDEEVLSKYEDKRRVPRTALLVNIEDVFLHCAKSVHSAKLWEPQSWPAERAIAQAGRVWADHMALREKE